MDILMNRFINKMNNNISRLHCNPYEDDSSGVLLNSGCQPVSPTKRKHHENQDSDEEHMNKMRPHRRNQNGDAVNPESWNHSSFGHASLSALNSRHVFAPFPIFADDQPIEMTKHSSDPTRSGLLVPGSGTKPQQVRLTQSEINRPSVITCAPASKRPCSLSSCHMSPNSCTSGSTNTTNANTECDPVIEEHFRRSLGKIYEEAVPVSDSVSIAGSVDDHFIKALGDAWLQIKAKGNDGAAPNHEGRC